MRSLRPVMLAVVVLGAAAIAACRTTVGDFSLWIRPATAIRSRTVDVGDTKQVQVPEYDPKGESFFVVVRIYPNDEANKDKVTTSNIREWPEKIRNKLNK